jgi:ABC-type polysaccharide/polyol phosphate transport system ATPase subunit
MTRVFLDNVSVDFPIYGVHQLSLRHTIARRAAGGLIQRDQRQKDRLLVRALSDVTLKLEEGDRLGLVGHNGSGKSTLLKTIAGIYEPVAGTISVRGRITPLFDMMPGLDIDDTGYENILTSGMLLGMTREYVESKIPEIEEVSELGDYLSLPVRTYSAGMTTRLGFALVTALDPDVLVMDEGFGAADLSFTERAAERMDEFIGRSRVMVLASHSDAMLQSICNKAALMKEGRILSVGSVEQIFDEYHFMVYGRRLERVQAVEVEIEEEELPPPPPPPPVYSEASIADLNLENRVARTNGAVRFRRLICCDAEGRSQWSFMRGQTIHITGEYEVLEDVSSLAMVLRLLTYHDTAELIVTDFIREITRAPLRRGMQGSATFSVDTSLFRSTTLSIYASLVDAGNSVGFDVVDQNVSLPQITICAERDGYLAGVVSIDCTFSATPPRTDSKTSGTLRLAGQD